MHDDRGDARNSWDAQLRNAIRRTHLEPYQKYFLEERVLDQARWMDEKAVKTQRLYYALRLTTIVGGVIAPALFSLGSSATHAVAVVTSLIVGLSAAIEEFFHAGDRWRHYRMTAELLKSQAWRFLELSDSYRRLGHRSHSVAYPEFVDRIERILGREVSVFVSRIAEDHEHDHPPAGPEGQVEESGSRAQGSSPPE